MLLVSCSTCNISFSQIDSSEFGGTVIDVAHILSEDEKEYLIDEIAYIEEETSTKIIIITTPSSKTTEWKIEHSEPENCILIIATVNYPRFNTEVRIGANLEETIDEKACKSLIAKDVSPAFVRKNYYAGLWNLVSSIHDSLYHEDFEEEYSEEDWEEYVNNEDYEETWDDSKESKEKYDGIAYQIIIGIFLLPFARLIKDVKAKVALILTYGTVCFILTSSVTLTIIVLLISIGILLGSWGRGSGYSGGRGSGSYSGGGGRFGGGGASGSW